MGLPFDPEVSSVSLNFLMMLMVVLGGAREIRREGTISVIHVAAPGLNTEASTRTAGPASRRMKIRVVPMMSKMVPPTPDGLSRKKK